jgi:hypothetical protein
MFCWKGHIGVSSNNSNWPPSERLMGHEYNSVFLRKREQLMLRQKPALF